MQACHVLLGRPWQYGRSTRHDGRTNTYSLVSNGRMYVLHHMSLSQVNGMYQKMSELRDKRKKDEGHMEIEGHEEEERRKLPKDCPLFEELNIKFTSCWAHNGQTKWLIEVIQRISKSYQGKLRNSKGYVRESTNDSTFIGKGSVKVRVDVYVLTFTSPLFVPMLRMICESVVSKVEAKLENTLIEVKLCDTSLYYVFTYDDAHAFEWSMFLEGKSSNRAKGVYLIQVHGFPFHLTPAVN
ncbi:hypothetical protein KY290_020868 [Solanum tuberosum]|uniref:Uncharacterized protein n=1 Tax=Solanum tuberosum TaxID=4113 RepID=A0ABQ7V2Y8_SOLTU|nr:hypothetical protein KY285_019835 [Solanum tuberosum]KAH0757375.1 hypothetical protein KY290_020868 [Solanum tuberosum]